MSEVGGEGTDRLRGRDLRALRWQLSALSDLTTDGQREVMITLCFWELETKLWSVFDSLEIFRAGWMDKEANQGRGAVLCGARFLDLW